MIEHGLITLPNTSTCEEILRVISRDGGVIISDFVDQSTLAAIMEDLSPWLNRTPSSSDAFAGNQTRRVGRLLARSTHIQKLFLDPLFIDPAREVLQKPAPIWMGTQRLNTTPNLQVGVTQLIDICPGQDLQPLHRDDGTCLWRHPQYDREARYQLMLAVTDFTDENGGTRVIPGSHRWDDDRMPTQEETVPTVMKSGSALFWLGSVYHGGGANRTDASRTGITLALDISVIRQEENQYLSIPKEVVKEMSPEMQKLIGWSVSDTYQGWVEVDGRMTDPTELLK